MATIGEDLISGGGAPFFKVANPDAVSITAPENRKGDALRTWVRSLSGFQKEAIIRSAKTGDTWRFVSDEGPYLNGHDAACCPLSFLSCGMAASYMNEILALAEIRSVAIRKLRLTQDNYYTMTGSMMRRTMVAAENIDLHVEIDCDLDEAAAPFLVDATYASPGLMRGRVDSLFKLGKNGAELPTAKALELDGALFPDPGDHFAAARRR